MTLADKPTIGAYKKRVAAEVAYLRPRTEEAQRNIEDRAAAQRANADPDLEAYMDRRIPNEPIDYGDDPGPEPDPDPWAVRDAARDKADEEAKADPIRAAIQIQSARVLDGWAFINQISDKIETVWGQDTEILWPKGEPCLLVGPSGVGKSTLTQQVLRAHIDGGEVLGYPVTPATGKILYLAMDRPAQIARSMARMFGADWETQLRDRLVVWRGPLPFNVVKQPEGLAIMCDELGASSLFVDSIKDMAPKMSDEETGSQINAAFQMCIVEGIEVFGIHHQRKAQGENKKPNKLSDVYGSQMMVNGAGSVILLWGEAGDPVVELSHLKQPMETVGPLTVTHDHYAGITTADEHVDAYQAIQGAWKGVDAPYVARAMTGNPEPSRSDIEKARRRLERLVRDGKARVEEGEKGGRGEGRRPTMWFPVVPDINHASITVLGDEDKSAGQTITEGSGGSITLQSREIEDPAKVQVRQSRLQSRSITFSITDGGIKTPHPDDGPDDDDEPF